MTLPFFLKNQKPKTEFLGLFDHFSHVFEFKTNISKCEVASIGILKGVHMLLYSMGCIILKADTVKIYGIYFSDNKKR